MGHREKVSGWLHCSRIRLDWIQLYCITQINQWLHATLSSTVQLASGCCFKMILLVDMLNYFPCILKSGRWLQCSQSGTHPEYSAFTPPQSISHNCAPNPLEFALSTMKMIKPLSYCQSMDNTFNLACLSKLINLLVHRFSLVPRIFNHVALWQWLKWL